MLKKISLPVLLTGMCFLITIVIGLVFLNKNKERFTKKTVTNKTEEIKITRTNYSEIARKTLDWIDQQRNEDGWYILERGCDFELKTCNTIWDNEEGNKDGLIATWARLNFYKQTKDPKDLVIVKKDIDLFYEKYKNDNLKDSLWICKITYEMAQSGYLDDGQKEKLKNLCLNTSFLSPEEMSDYQKVVSSRIEKLDSGVVIWKTWNGYHLVVRGFDNYFGIGTDLVYRYLWSEDKTYLDLAKKHLEKMKDILDKEKDEVVAENLCLAGYSSLDIYENSNKEDEYLNYAKDIFVTFINNKGDRKKFQTTICGLLAKKIYGLSKDKIFLVGVENENKVLTKNLLDGGDSFANENNDYGFFKATTGGLDIPYKNIAENGLIVELIKD